jgi:hypothetical protein
VQVVGYETSPSPALQVAREGVLDRVSLDPETTLEFALGARHCAGLVTDDGRHVTCDVPDAPYCETHSKRWACAMCTGDCSLPLPACREEHAVYLAAFAPDVWKVGVTRSWRLETRLNEQGADKAAHIRTVDSGRHARRIEAGIAERVPDRVRVPAKIEGLHLSVDEAAWETFLGDFDPLERFEFEYGFALDRRPVAETTATGTVVGTKGRVTVLDRGGTRYAVDLRDLVGHDIDEGVSQGDRQSSLHTF